MYEKIFEIPYFQCDNKGDLKADYLLKYLGEMANLHSDELGLTFDYFKEKNMAWVLNRWKVNIDVFPKFKERIKIRTWTVDFNKFYAYRNFEVIGEDEKIIIYASSIWLLIDLKKKRPIKIPEYLANRYRLKKGIVPEFYKFKEDICLRDSLSFNVRKADIDYNQHVNNSNYLNWILESIPIEYEKENRLREFEILYKKETLYGEKIQSKLGLPKGGDCKNQYIHQVIGEEVEDIKTLARTLWTKKLNREGF